MTGRYSSAQITAAIHAALKAHDMEAVAGLLRLLAVEDPQAAELILHAANLLPGDEAVSA